MRIILLILIALVVSSPALADLYKARSIRCTFDKGNSSDYRDKKLNLNWASFGKENQFVFDNINIKNNNARFIGSIGAEDVQLLAEGNGLNFIEKTGTGNINLTTIFPFQNSKGKYVAVTSRHVTLIEPIPSQYHGECEILQ